MRRIACVTLLLAAFGFADTTNYTYDDAGRLLRVQYSSGTTITYTYDRAGNLLQREVTSAKTASSARKPQPAEQRKTESQRKQEAR